MTLKCASAPVESRKSTYNGLMVVKLRITIPSFTVEVEDGKTYEQAQKDIHFAVIMAILHSRVGFSWANVEEE